jgi:hypothetical protein
VILFRIVEILFELFVENSNGELIRTTTILSPPWNSRITTILTVPEQLICVWIHNCYSYSENNNYFAIHSSSKHILQELFQIYEMGCFKILRLKLVLNFILII